MTIEKNASASVSGLIAPITASLARRVAVRASRASADDIANAIVATFLDLDHTLLPILGRKGVGAVWEHSIFLAQIEHPWLKLPPSDKDSSPPMQVIALREVLRNQSAAVAKTGGIVLLILFTDILISLIGLSLAERLLRPVWNVPTVEPLTLVRSR